MGYDFTFAGQSLSDFFGVTTARPPREIAERDFEMIKIPGRSKLEYIDNKRYENVNMTREIGLIRRPLNAPETIVEDIIDWLTYSQGYQEFEDTDHPGMVTYAVLTNFNEVQTLLRRYYKAKLKFSRVPYWYDKSGLQRQAAADPSVGIQLQNPYWTTSKPLIECVIKQPINNNMQFKLRVNGTDYLYKMSRLPFYSGQERPYMYIDTEDQEIRMQTTEAGANIAYADEAMPEQFEEYYLNSVSIYTGYPDVVTALYVTPRWRCL